MWRRAAPLLLLACLPAALEAGDGPDHALAEKVQHALQRVADEMHAKYDMSLAGAFYSPRLSLAVAAGYTDSGLGMGTATRKGKPDDLYVWGSTTKMFTAPAVLRLVEGGIVALTDPIAEHIDPIFSHLSGGRTLADHFGSAIGAVQVGHLLHMTSGIADYDQGPFSKAQFANRSKAFGPVEIILNYVTPQLQSRPGSSQQYCSTNYILLGLVLAGHYHRQDTTWSWQDLDQASVIPDALRKAFNHSQFALSGPCKDFTPVHGFMESYPTASLPAQDVWNVSCLGGWTAGNYIGSVSDVARFTYELYNKMSPGIISTASQALLTDFTAPGFFHQFKFYGMGTFSLDWSVGDAEAYGHVGDTYGYQSQTTYFPGHDFVISVATNVETTSQAQPADFTCLAYHAIVSVLNGTSPPSCTFTVPTRFIGKCVCSGDSITV